MALFLALIAVGTLLLMLPVMTPGQGPSAGLPTALFTATSAVTVTGLSTVDVQAAWTTTGQAVILLLIQLGGFGIATTAALASLVFAKRLDLRSRLRTQAETPWLTMGELSQVLRLMLRITVVVEACVGLVLMLRFWSGYGHSPLTAGWEGLFLSVSAFNNAGFSVFSNGLMDYNTDPVILGAIALAIIIGGLGVPVLIQVRAHWRRPRRMSVHAKLTVYASLGLIVAGAVLLYVTEFGQWAQWGGNPSTMVLNALFSSVTSRTAGFNSVDYGQTSPASLLITAVLMFIGGGSASTAGGIKVTTFVVLFMVFVAEVRGDRDVMVAGRRIPERVQRAAIAVTFSYLVVTAAGLLIILEFESLPLQDVVFETVSAVTTTGLSTGITGELSWVSQVVLIVLMFIGRLGTVTLTTAFALRQRRVPYRVPEGWPIVG